MGNLEQLLHVCKNYKQHALDYVESMGYDHGTIYITLYQDIMEFKELEVYIQENSLVVDTTLYRDFSQEEQEKIPYYKLNLNFLDAKILTSKEYGTKYIYNKCEQCQAGKEQLSPIYIPENTMLGYDIISIQPEVIISNQLKKRFEIEAMRGAGYREVFDKKTKKTSKEFWQLCIHSNLPKLKEDTTIGIRPNCESCGRESVVILGTCSYKLTDFDSKQDFYLTEESVHFARHWDKRNGYRLHEVIISKRTKEILDEYSGKNYSCTPVYFEELY